MAQSSDHAFSFADLTPDAILDAIESTGIYVDSGLLALNSYENRAINSVMKIIRVMSLVYV